MHCAQSTLVATRLHADQFTQVEVFVPEERPAPVGVRLLASYDELATVQGTALLHSVCLLRGIITSVLKVPFQRGDGMFSHT